MKTICTSCRAIIYIKEEQLYLLQSYQSKEGLSTPAAQLLDLLKKSSYICCIVTRARKTTFTSCRAIILKKSSTSCQYIISMKSICITCRATRTRKTICSSCIALRYSIKKEYLYLCRVTRARKTTYTSCRTIRYIISMKSSYISCRDFTKRKTIVAPAANILYQ